MKKLRPFSGILFAATITAALPVSGTVSASDTPMEATDIFLKVHPFSEVTATVSHSGAIERGRSAFFAGRSGHPLPTPGRIDAAANRRATWSASTGKRARLAPFEDVDLTAEARESSAGPVGASDPRTASLVRELTDLLHGGGKDVDVEKVSVAHRSVPDGRDAPWTADHLLADATHMNDEYISIAASPVSDNLYAVFEATDLGGTDRDIHIARSIDNGATWDVWEMPSFSQDEYHPELAIDAGGYLLVTWIREDGYILRSKTANPDDPLLWSWVKGLYVGEPCATPSIAVKRQGSNGKVFIAAAWNTINYDLLAYEWTLIWMYSTDGGETIAYDYFLPDGYNDYWPDVALKGSTCYFINAEQDYYSGEFEVVVAVDDISGAFVNPASLTGWTAMDCKFPVITNSIENVFMAFQLNYDDGLGNVDGDIIYCYSWDGLNEIYGPFGIVADEYESIGPALYSKDGTVGCLWLDAPPGGDEFYLAARQAGGNGHSDYWGDIEIVSDAPYVSPTFHSAFGLTAGDSLHAAWIDRRDYPTQGLNVYTCERNMEANLAPFTPAGWGAPLVVSMMEGERTTGWLAAGDTAYVSFACINGGLTDIAEDFHLRLMIDGSPGESWIVEGGLEGSAYVTVEDYPIVADEGSHIVGFEIDYLAEVAEMDETDNTHADTLDFIDGDPALRFNPDHVTHNYDEPVLKRGGAMRIASDPPVEQKTRMEAIDPRLAEAIRIGDANERMRVVIVPSARVDVAAISFLLADAGKRDRRDVVSVALKIQSERNRTLLSGAWSELVSRGCMSEPKPLWLPGMFSARMNAEAIDKLAKNPSVARLWLDDLLSGPRAFHEPVDADVSAASCGVKGERANAWHIAKTGANSAWSQGYDGSGILIGHLDSGLAYDHPDLAAHLWDGSPAYPNHGYDTVDDDNDPYDGDTEWYHGTHTAGLIVGDGTGGTVTGVAPGAELMVLRCMPGYYDDLVDALQICLDNGADLLSMSAGWMDPPSDLREGNRYNAEVLLTAGIPWVCAGGNGDNMGGHYAVPTDIASPGDCPNPWYGSAGHSSVIAVGALTSTNAVWSNSSYGPTEWDISPSPEGYDDYPYTPGLMKPDVAAPGVNVTSTTQPSGYVAYDGTSMATPQVAGACAILMQASPGVLPEELAEALEGGALDLTVSPASAGRDNYTGAGLIDIPASLDLLPTSDKEFFYVCNDGDLPLLIHHVAWTESWLQITPPDGLIDPGDSLQFTAQIDPDSLDWGVHEDYALFTTNDPLSPNALPVTVTVGNETGVSSATPPAPPSAGLSNRPNPFNPRTAVRFDNPRRGRVALSIYSSSGRLVRRLVDGVLDPGSHEVVWDGRDDRGRGLASGVYLARLEIPDGRRISRKMLLLR